jgi:hypothetical protein
MVQPNEPVSHQIRHLVELTHNSVKWAYKSFIGFGEDVLICLLGGFQVLDRAIRLFHSLLSALILTLYCPLGLSRFCAIVSGDEELFL